MEKNIFCESTRYLFALILVGLLPSVYASPDYESAIRAIKETVSDPYKETSDPYEYEMANQRGTINGINFIATLIGEDTYVVVSIVTPRGSYKPIARAELGLIPYPSVRIENDLVVIRAGYANHGTYETEYKFRLKSGTFYLTEIRDFAIFNAIHHDPSTQVMRLTVADFEEFRVDYWERQFTLSKNNKEYRRGTRAWSKAMESYKRDSKLPFPPSVSTDLPRHSFALDRFKFDDVYGSVKRAIARQQKVR